MRIPHVAFGLALACLPAAAGTWIVDDDGGAGVDFTEIQPAIDAAVPGDVIRVRPGSYKHFTLGKALAIVGEPGATVSGGNTTWVTGVDTGQLVVVAGLNFWGGIYVWECSVPVVLDGLLTHGTVRAGRSLDVRVRGCDTDGMFAHEGSRLEISESLAFADKGMFGYPYGWPGGPCLVCDESSVVHVYRTMLRGGQGGDSDAWHGGLGGDGGDAVHGSGELLLAGDATHTVLGGTAGSPSGGGLPGIGMKLTAPAFARVSGVTVNGIAQGSGTSLEQPSPPDPALRILAPVGPGGTLTFRLHSVPGSTAALNVGRVPTVQSVPGPTEDVLVVTLRTFDMGVVDSNGVAGFNLQLPLSATTGLTFFAQARVTLPGGETRYSNSVPLVVR